MLVNFFRGGRILIALQAYFSFFSSWEINGLIKNNTHCIGYGRLKKKSKSLRKEFNLMLTLQ